MYSRSSSDFINRKRNQALQNTFQEKSSSNLTKITNIKTIMNTCSVDENGYIEIPTWYNVPLSTTYPNCINADFGDRNKQIVYTTPRMYVIPKQTNGPSWNIRYEPNFCGFPVNKTDPEWVDA
jgi:hypothetical protein